MKVFAEEALFFQRFASTKYGHLARQFSLLSRREEMTIFHHAGFTASELGAALADVLIDEFRANGNPLCGFPQISVGSRELDFEATIKFGEFSAPTFVILKHEAFDAVAAMRDRRKYSAALYDRVQQAAIALDVLAKFE